MLVYNNQVANTISNGRQYVFQLRHVEFFVVANLQQEEVVRTSSSLKISVCGAWLRHDAGYDDQCRTGVDAE